MKRISLTREVNGHTRYYKIVLSKTLFGEYGVERVYGAERNKKPTGHKENFFETIETAMRCFEDILKTKYAKGYSLPRF